MKMKIIIFLAVVAIAAAELKLKTREEYLKIRKDCDVRYQIPNELRERTKHDKYPPKEIVEYIICKFRGLEVWNDSNGFSVDRIMVSLDRAKRNIENYNDKLLREAIIKCSDKNSEGSLPLDWAYRCFYCFVDNKYLFDALKAANFYQEIVDNSEEYEEK